MDIAINWGSADVQVVGDGRSLVSVDFRHEPPLEWWQEFMAVLDVRNNETRGEPWGRIAPGPRPGSLQIEDVENGQEPALAENLKALIEQVTREVERQKDSAAKKQAEAAKRQEQQELEAREQARRFHRLG